MLIIFPDMYFGEKQLGATMDQQVVDEKSKQGMMEELMAKLKEDLMRGRKQVAVQDDGGDQVKENGAVHLNTRPYHCQEPGCAAKFGRRSDLSHHIQTVHRGEKPYICKETGCSKIFGKKSHLDRH